MEKILYEEQAKYLDSFKKKKSELVREMEAFALERKIPILNARAVEFLELLIAITKPKRVLEVGTAIGYSTIRMASRLPKKGVVHTIEISRDNIPLAMNNFNKSGLGDKIKLFEGDAFVIMPKLKKKYDLIFLDADKKDYVTLLPHILRLLKKEGILFVDNLLWRGQAALDNPSKGFKRSAKQVKEFNEVFMSLQKLDASILSIGDGIGLAIKKGKKK